MLTTKTIQSIIGKDECFKGNDEISNDIFIPPPNVPTSGTIFPKPAIGK